MERESAVREILQSIGPLFPEDAAKARAARKEALAQAAEAPLETPVPAMTATPKPMLASQIDSAEKTEVASLADVLQRLAPAPAATSVRDSVPELVRPLVPEVSALRAALNLREPESEPAPIDTIEPVPAEAIPAFTELPAEPSVEMSVEDTLVEAGDVVFLEPSAAEIQEALAQAIEAQRDPSEKAESKPTPAPEPEPVPPTADSSEDEHDAFVYAIADAILPARPYPQVTKPATSALVEPVVEAEPVVEPVVTQEVTPVEAPLAEQPKPKFKRAKPKKVAEAAKPEIVQVEPPKAAEPAVRPEPAPSIEDDELIRQIRVHREDMIDVDDQIARIDQEIAAEQQAMAHYVSLVEQKHAHRSRLMRLRTNTQRFVDALQLKAEPLKRPAKVEKKSA